MIKEAPRLKEIVDLKDQGDQSRETVRNKDQDQTKNKVRVRDQDQPRDREMPKVLMLEMEDKTIADSRKETFSLKEEDFN